MATQYDTFIGIDPGVSGGFAIIETHAESMLQPPAFKCIEPVPFGCLEAFATHISCYGQACILLEKVHSSPQMGVSTAFKFGKVCGQIEGVLAAYEYAPIEVTPQTWQSALNCRTGGDKKITHALAKKLFPDVKITHATADACLIAYYGYLKYGKRRSGS